MLCSDVSLSPAPSNGSKASYSSPDTSPRPTERVKICAHTIREQNRDETEAKQREPPDRVFFFIQENKPHQKMKTTNHTRTHLAI